MLKYYSVQDVEDLANTYYDYRETIKGYITVAMKEAVQNLYQNNNKTMSDKVLAFFG